MTSLTLRAPAKINLYLHVTGKREDGYHLLDSLTVFAKDVADTVRIEKSDRFSFTASGPFGGLIEADNLVSRAAALVAQTAGRATDVTIHLDKHIPLGAGLGGGSADAAATVRGLEQFWNIALPPDQRDEILLALGADVPVCYHGQTSRFQGIGDEISDVPPLPPLPPLLLWPDCHSATRDVFAKRNGDFRTAPTQMPDGFADAKAVINFLKTAGNDLEAAAQSLQPAIAQADRFLKSQSACLLSRMSGSGSSVFGIFETQEAAIEARDACQRLHPTWWAHTTVV